MLVLEDVEVLELVVLLEEDVEDVGVLLVVELVDPEVLGMELGMEKELMKLDSLISWILHPVIISARNGKPKNFLFTMNPLV